MRMPSVRACVAVLVLSSSLRAQSLVQLTIEGEIDRPGGAWVDVEVVAVPGTDGARSASLGLHLAEKTAAADVVALLTRRMEAAGMHAVFASERTGPRTLAHVFVEDCVAVNLHLGHGLAPTVTLCETAPASLKVVPPIESKGKGFLTIAASTWHAPSQTPNRLSIELELDDRRAPTMIAEDLVTRSIQLGWLAERLKHEAWHPTGMADGSIVKGSSIALQTTGADWRMEIGIGPPSRR